VGGTREDETVFFGNATGANRYFRHFHDPLFQADGSRRGPWAQAGVTLRGQQRRQKGRHVVSTC